MATALKEEREVIRAEFAAGNGRLLGDDADILAWQYPNPTRYVVREIDFQIDGNGFLQFFFRNPELAKQLQPGETIDDVVADLLNPNAKIMQFFGATIPAPGPRTPLDINLQTSSAYIIYRLAPDRNMLFAPRMAGVTHKKIIDQPYCGDLLHVNQSGPSQIGLDDSRLVYFKARPGADPNDYAHGLNLKVRLLQAPHYGSAWPSVLDLGMDPDIRNPGGSPT